MREVNLGLLVCALITISTSFTHVQAFNQVIRCCVMTCALISSLR